MKFVTTLIIIAIFFSNSLFAQEYNFIFGNKTKTANTININENIFFSATDSYGFDIENKNSVTINQEYGFCTSDKPFYFSTKMPEGTYSVTLEMGNSPLPSTCFVKAESRRLMVYNLKIDKNELKKVSFTVDVRTPKIDEENSIGIKSRDVNSLNWDNRLTLEFSGENIAVHSISIKPKENYTTLYLAGNSTVTDQDCAPWASWGQMITNYFDTDISVANYAESGASLASFKSSRRLDKILSTMKPNDYVFIEFGHNDQKRKGEGIGPWLSFTDLLKEFITRTREKGGIPVLVTPTQRRSFNEEGIIKPTHGEYPDAMRKVAKDLNVPLIDLHRATKKLYENWGIKYSKKGFVHYPAKTFPAQFKALADNTHFNTFGAHEVALNVLTGIQSLTIELKNNIVGFMTYNVEKPNKIENWLLPMSPRFVSKKPDGN